MSYTLHVQPDVVFLEPVELEEVRSSGLIVSTTTSRTPAAKVSHIHPDTSATIGVNVGDRVIFNPFSIYELNISSTESRLAIHPGDILATVGDA